MIASERLILVGQGGKDDVEEALVELGRALGFEVVVVDPNPQLRAKPDRLVTAAVPDPAELVIGPRDSVVVLTKGERDVAVLRALANSPSRYVGLLGSRRRVQKDREELHAAGVGKAFLTGLHAPIGIDVGAQSPAEIAISILAEVIAAKYGKSVPRPSADATPNPKAS